jgi:hypothetical protein
MGDGSRAEIRRAKAPQTVKTVLMHRAFLGLALLACSRGTAVPDPAATDASVAVDAGAEQKDACAPSCAARECGPDGCGGTCGTQPGESVGYCHCEDGKWVDRFKGLPKTDPVCERKKTHAECQEEAWSRWKGCAYLRAPKDASTR